MPNFLILGIYLLLSGDGKGAGWNCFLRGAFVEDKADNYGVSNFTGMTIWRLFFPDGDIKTEMMSSPWNNFVRSLLRFVVVIFVHDERLGIISFRPVFLILRWQKTRKRKTQERRSFSTPSAGMLAVVRWAYVLRLVAECLPVRSSMQNVKYVWF
jgi:hypothetical protein